MCEPPTKVSRQSIESTHFKHLKAIKNHPTLIYRWFHEASPEALQLAGTYGLHLLIESGNIQLTGEILKSVINISPDTVGSNPELAIILIQYLTLTDDFAPAVEIALRFTGLSAANPGPCRIRKRAVDLILHALYTKADWVSACDVILTFLVNGPFKPTIEDLQPILFSCDNPFIQRTILTWFVGQELYLPLNAQIKLSNAPAGLLQLNPVVSPEMLEAIYNRLPMNPGQPVKYHDQEIHTKYVIDGANVLFSSHNGINKLDKIIDALTADGSVVTLVLHKRHFQQQGKMAKHLQKFLVLDSSKVQLVQTPYGVNDDYYSIYIAMKNNGLLVTNDKFRDHIYHINPLIAKWYKQSVITFNNDGEFTMPYPYSHCIQQLGDADAFWIPSTEPSLGYVWGTEGSPHL